MTIEVFIKKMKEEEWKPQNWKVEELAGIPPYSYDVEFADDNHKVIMVKGQTIMSMVTTEFDKWIKNTNREAYNSNFIQIF
jgi:hypothetical protein